MKTYIVDSFTDRVFKGNPAGVCMPVRPLSSALMLSIAQELNLSETAIVVKESEYQYAIRYYSPKIEIPLCGHATLAAAKILLESSKMDCIRFITIEKRILPVRKIGHLIEMEFPVYETINAVPPDPLLHALGITDIVNSVYNEETKILLIEIDSAILLANLQPNYLALYNSHNSLNGVLVTAKSMDDTYDFHSRYFWPWSGIKEDPVTGGTPTFLAMYWSRKLYKTNLRSFQSSVRTGFMEVELTENNTVLIRGRAVLVLKGEIYLD